MVFMSVTLEVFQLERSPRVVREEQPENMLPMLVTLLVLQPERLRDVREVQPENMLPVDVSNVVFNLVKSQFSNAEVVKGAAANQQSVFFGVIPSSTTVTVLIEDL